MCVYIYTHTSIKLLRMLKQYFSEMDQICCLSDDKFLINFTDKMKSPGISK